MRSYSVKGILIASRLTSKNNNLAFRFKPSMGNEHAIGAILECYDFNWRPPLKSVGACRRVGTAETKYVYCKFLVSYSRTYYQDYGGHEQDVCVELMSSKTLKTTKKSKSKIKKELQRDKALFPQSWLVMKC